MSTWSLTYRQSVFQWQQSKTFLRVFFPQDGGVKTSWHRYGTKLRHGHPVYIDWACELTRCVCWSRRRRGEDSWREFRATRTATDRRTDWLRQRAALAQRSSGQPASCRLDGTIYITYIHYIHPFNGPLSGTTRVSRYQKGKTRLDFTESRDSEWQWHQLFCSVL